MSGEKTKPSDEAETVTDANDAEAITAEDDDNVVVFDRDDAEGTTPSNEGDDDVDEDAPRDPAEIIIALNEENTELKNKAITLLADMENLRRRTEREVKDARQYAVANFARDMLSVSDNLSRALQALPEDVRKEADEALKTLLEGVEMTDRDLQNQLTKNGVQKLEPEGERFDPNFHQAMFEVPNPDVPNGTVTQVVQAGYKIGDRVLRPAMVGVTKGGPKAPKQAAKEEIEPGSTVDKSV